MCEDLKLWMPECIYYFRQTAASPNDPNYPYYTEDAAVNGKVVFNLLEEGKMHPVLNKTISYQYPDLAVDRSRSTWSNGLSQFL